MVINHNLPAGNVKRQLNVSNSRKKKSLERLSSGYSINRAADDAAGLSISEKMRGQIRGLTRAAQNVQDGISFAQTADGALDEVQAMLQRIRELAVQAGNDTNTDEDRECINKEVQEIKKEMSRVFNDAEFNTIKIFRAHYTPDVDGAPLDYELFNSADGNRAGGVLINHKRYSWEEINLPRTPMNSDWETRFKDTNGEIIHLKLKAGDLPSEMRRVYEMEADDRGIKINNLYAAYWDSTIQQNEDTYSFSYRGMNISFNANPEDTREDIIKQLCSDGLSYNSWDAIPVQGATSSAVNITGDTMRFFVTNNNMNDIEDWEYRLEANDKGVELIQTSGNDGLNHTKTNWASFQNTNSGPAYPITDWGTGTEKVNSITLTSIEEGAAYNYTDNAKASFIDDGFTIDFNFPLEEVSKKQVMDGITQNLTSTPVIAPIKSVTLSSSNKRVMSYNFNFEFQRDSLLRDFGDSGLDSEMALSIKRTRVYELDSSYVWKYKYEAYNSQGTLVMDGMSRETILGYYDDFDLHVTLKDVSGGDSFLALYDNNIYGNNFTATITPSGKAYREFTSEERSAGLATNTSLTCQVNPTEKVLRVQAGANADQIIEMRWPGLSNSIIGIGAPKFDSSDGAQATITMVDNAIGVISGICSLFGAYQNRMEHAFSVDQNTAENLQYAESRIRDADMAEEMMSFSKSEVLENAAMSMMAQANQHPEGILKMLS